VHTLASEQMINIYVFVTMNSTKRCRWADRTLALYSGIKCQSWNQLSWLRVFT